MKVKVEQIKAEATPLAYVEEAAGLNARLSGGAPDFRMDQGLSVDLVHYRAGLDLFFTGTLRAEVTGTCARCLDEYVFRLEAPFTFVLAPRVVAGEGAEPELSADDLSLSFFEGEEIDLSPLVHEQAILALPTRPLCRDDCRGLCARCGANLNAGPCGCPAETPDPRLSVLRTLLRSDH